MSPSTSPECSTWTTGGRRPPPTVSSTVPDRTTKTAVWGSPCLNKTVPLGLSRTSRYAPRAATSLGRSGAFSARPTQRATQAASRNASLAGPRDRNIVLLRTLYGWAQRRRGIRDEGGAGGRPMARSDDPGSAGRIDQTGTEIRDDLPPAELLARAGAEATGVIESWPSKPREAAIKTIQRYGAPDAVMPSRLIWTDKTPWRRVVVNRDVVPHDFPKPHNDLLEEWISYRIPSERLDDVARFDGSVMAER